MVVDDHFVVRMGLKGSINLEQDMTVDTEASTGEQAVTLYQQERPDIVLMDLKLPGISGTEATKAICQEFPAASIIMLSTHDGEEDIYRSLQAGARAYLLKTAAAEDVIAAVREAAAGTASLSPELLTRFTQALRRPPPPDPLQPLSPRERDVLGLIARGHSNRQIARTLAIGEETVKTHVRSILTKLGLQDRVQAAIFALRHQADGR